MTTDVATLLAEARALIADEQHWVKNDDYVLLPDGSRARCAAGAVSCAAGGALRDFWLSIDALRQFLPPGNGLVMNFNDHPTTTHPDVLALFDRAIAAARNEDTP